MKVVSERSAEDIAADKKAREQQFALDDFDGAMADLAANLLRVIRGGGKGYEIGRQAQHLLNTMQRHWDAFGHYPSEADYHRALRYEEQSNSDYGPRQRRKDALEQVMRGSLQVIASRLVGQHMQAAAGETEMHRGLDDYEAWAEEMRRQRAEAARSAREAARSAKKKPAPRKK